MVNNRKERWQYAQTKEDSFWQRKDVFDDQINRVVSRYGPVISELSKELTAESRILDVGCGPTCAGQLFRTGSKTFLDPLMDSYLKTYPEKIPEGEKLSCPAENIPKEDESYDVVVSFNALDHMINPADVLSEIRRVLKRDGTFLLGIFLHPAPVAVLRRFVEKCLPFLREDAHPYSFTPESIRELLGEYFNISKEIRVFRKDSALFPSLHREDWVFVCKK